MTSPLHTVSFMFVHILAAAALGQDIFGLTQQDCGYMCSAAEREDELCVARSIRERQQRQGILYLHTVHRMKSVPEQEPVAFRAAILAHTVVLLFSSTQRPYSSLPFLVLSLLRLVLICTTPPKRMKCCEDSLNT